MTICRLVKGKTSKVYALPPPVSYAKTEVIYDYPAHWYSADVIQMAGTSREKVAAFHDDLAGFRYPSGHPTLVEETAGPLHIRRYTGEFWTSRQRQASSLHQILPGLFKPSCPVFSSSG